MVAEVSYVKAKTVNIKCPILVINYYQKLIIWEKNVLEFYMIAVHDVMETFLKLNLVVFHTSDMCI